MATYTSSLPQALLDQLNSLAKELNVPKNRIIEKALTIYLTELDKAAFRRSFQKASPDRDLLNIVEEDMTEYLQELKNWDETR